MSETKDNSNLCPKCNKPYWSDGTSTIMDLCECFKNVTPANYGWVCPLCGTVNAPWVQACHCSTNPQPLTPYCITSK